VEVLVVLVIIGLLLGVATPVYTRMLPRLRMLSNEHALLLDLRRARMRAVTMKKETDIQFDMVRGVYVFEGKTSQISVTMQATLPEDKVVRFYPDGSATPIRIELSDGTRHSVLTIEALTGLAVAHD
jgi:type II secretory pathway pseudopilin PulG